MILSSIITIQDKNKICGSSAGVIKIQIRTKSFPFCFLQMLPKKFSFQTNLNSKNLYSKRKNYRNNNTSISIEKTKLHW